MIYLDNNATTPVDPEVADVVFSSLKRDVGNPSSSHRSGRRVRESIESSRSHISAFFDCAPDEIFFTSGGTESNNLAILGSVLFRKSGHVITSSIEHPSVLSTCAYLASLGFEISHAPVDSEGIVNVEEIRKAIRKDTVLISVMHSNNETGVIQPVAEIGEIARKQGIPFHVDAAQSIGKMHFIPSEMPIDILTIVSHKFYGPKGIGALFVRNGITVKPLLFGGGHERGLRPGTENVSGIAGLAKACQLAERDIRLRVSHTSRLSEILWNHLRTVLPDIILNGHLVRRLPNTLNIQIPGIFAHELVEHIRDSVAVSTGSACHAGVSAPSRVLKQMGLSDEAALSSVRFSLGKDNTEEEVRKAVDIIAGAVTLLRGRKSAGT